MVALLIAVGLGLITAIALTPVLIRTLHARGVGQPILEEGPQGHHLKAGTPTMGGITVVIAAIAGYLAAHIRSGAVFTGAGVLVLLAIVGAGGVGLVDDLIKVRNQRNLGLTKWAKTSGLLVTGVVFGILAVQLAGARSAISFAGRPPGVHLNHWMYVGWAALIIVGSANAANLTDGLDGLLAGSSIFAFAAFVFIGFWEFRHFKDVHNAVIYGVGPGLDLALVAAAMAGGCSGFLWWNAAPARIFMGDTGSLAIGAGLAALALTTNTHLLLPVIGGLYVMVTLSVVIQVAAFRMFGRRVFRMAPLHHHFELLGWPETTVIVRFWILAGLCTAFAMGIFYADFLSRTGGFTVR